MPTPLPPPEVLHALGLARWPSDQPTRSALTRSLRMRDPALWLRLVTWAHGVPEQPPTITAWATLLGVHSSTVKAWRSSTGPQAVPEIAALPVGDPGRRTRKGDTRAVRDARRGTPRGRPRKTGPEPPEAT